MSIVIVGAGPAGIAAAVTLADAGARVTLLDDNPCAGGQIWRGGNLKSSKWLERLTHSNAVVITGARVISADAVRQTVLVDVNGKAEEIAYSKLILATGARELFLPFPGWTLPNVMGVGGLQALVKSGLPVNGKRVVVAGSGPLLLAVASYLRKCGALVPLIAEQARATSLASFALSLAAHPAKLRQSLALNPFFGGTHYLSSCWVDSADGSNKLERVRLRRGSRVWEEPCDYLANSHGFVANAELAMYMGCAVESGSVKVDQWQQTSLPDIYCAGEIAGIGGVDTALLEGQIAAFAVSGQPSQAATLHRRLRKAKSFARLLNKTFELRAELGTLAQPDTIVCRCEDVTLSACAKPIRGVPPSCTNAAAWALAKAASAGPPYDLCWVGSRLPCGRRCFPRV